jgi:FKBP-type peptidyl-prolyl cis-trans isomerase
VNTRLSIAVIILFLISYSCKSEKGPAARNVKPGVNEMADLNRYLVQKDREKIQSYIERKGLPVTESPTGLWYYIINEGSGSYFKEFDNLKMDYDCSLLDGTPIYSSSEKGPKEVTLGRSEIEPGLYQGLLKLKPGAEAVFIIPPFLAYGLKGDGKKIPPRSVLVYNIHILHD